MKDVELTEIESETYLRIVKSGNMDVMFNYGYVIGRERVLKDIMDIVKIKQ